MPSASQIHKSHIWSCI